MLGGATGARIFTPDLSNKMASPSTGRNQSETAAVSSLEVNRAFHHTGGHRRRKVFHHIIIWNPFKVSPLATVGVLEGVPHLSFDFYLEFNDDLGCWDLIVETLSHIIEITFVCLDELSRAIHLSLGSSS